MEGPGGEGLGVPDPSADLGRALGRPAEILAHVWVLLPPAISSKTLHVHSGDSHCITAVSRSGHTHMQGDSRDGSAVAGSHLLPKVGIPVFPCLVSPFNPSEPSLRLHKFWGNI